MNLWNVRGGLYSSMTPVSQEGDSLWAAAQDWPVGSFRDEQEAQAFVAQLEPFCDPINYCALRLLDIEDDSQMMLNDFQTPFSEAQIEEARSQAQLDHMLRTNRRQAKIQPLMLLNDEQIQAEFKRLKAAVLVLDPKAKFCNPPDDIFLQLEYHIEASEIRHYWPE